MVILQLVLGLVSQPAAKLVLQLASNWHGLCVSARWHLPRSAIFSAIAGATLLTLACEGGLR